MERKFCCAKKQKQQSVSFVCIPSERFKLFILNCTTANKLHVTDFNLRIIANVLLAKWSFRYIIKNIIRLNFHGVLKNTFVEVKTN